MEENNLYRLTDTNGNIIFGNSEAEVFFKAYRNSIPGYKISSLRDGEIEEEIKNGNVKKYTLKIWEERKYSKDLMFDPDVYFEFLLPTKGLNDEIAERQIEKKILTEVSQAGWVEAGREFYIFEGDKIKWIVNVEKFSQLVWNLQ